MKIAAVGPLRCLQLVWCVGKQLQVEGSRGSYSGIDNMGQDFVRGEALTRKQILEGWGWVSSMGGSIEKDLDHGSWKVSFSAA